MPSLDLAIVDYGSGNLKSVSNAVKKIAGQNSVKVTSDPELIRSANRIILPGVGAFGDCMLGLKSQTGVLESLHEAVHTRAVPFLGICVGMQLLVKEGHEHGVHHGLGWFDGETRFMQPVGDQFRIPHMGWNRIHEHVPHPVTQGLHNQDVYFVHSYAVFDIDQQHILASTDHGGLVTAAIARDNIIGVQFHPEKSQSAGLHLLQNFLEWAP